MLNVLDTVSKGDQAITRSHLQAMIYAESREEALTEKSRFEADSRGHSPPKHLRQSLCDQG